MQTGVMERVLATAEQMLVDRGCEHVTRCSHDDVASARPTPALCASSAAREVTYEVYIHRGEQQVSVKFIRAILDAECSPTLRVIIASASGPTPYTRRETNGKVEFFLFRQLCFNITRHTLVPKHERAEYVGNTRELPQISITDPVVAYYGYRPGDVLKITRTFTTQPVDFYRVVVCNGKAHEEDEGTDEVFMTDEVV